MSMSTLVRRRAAGRSTASATGLMAASAAVLVTILTVGAAVVVPRALPSRADSAPVNPADPATPPTVTADALPTVQIDGVAWSQVIVGNRVFVGGRFDNARPAGSPVGVGNVARSQPARLRHRDRESSTSSFAPVLNAQVRSIAGVTRRPRGSMSAVTSPRSTDCPAIAWLRSTSPTGALIGNVRPRRRLPRVLAWSPTDSTVYVGGNFKASAPEVRVRSRRVPHVGRGAARLGTDCPRGAWSPRWSSRPTVRRSSSAGAFTAVNGSTDPGTASPAVDAISGAMQPWAINGVIRNAGNSSGRSRRSHRRRVRLRHRAIVYGSRIGNLEGVFSARWSDGGDRTGSRTATATPTACTSRATSSTRSATRTTAATSAASRRPTPWTFHRAIAFSRGRHRHHHPRRRTATTNFERSARRRTLLNWFPQVEMGHLHRPVPGGRGTVTGNAQYVVMGGEFPSVNGTAQQGLVRFAVPVDRSEATGGPAVPRRVAVEGQLVRGGRGAAELEPELGP